MKDLSWPARRTHDRFCCDGLCTSGACPLLTDPAYRESAADFADERYPFRVESESLTCRLRLRFIVGLLFAGFIWVVTR